MKAPAGPTSSEVPEQLTALQRDIHTSIASIITGNSRTNEPIDGALGARRQEAFHLASIVPIDIDACTGADRDCFTGTLEVGVCAVNNDGRTACLLRIERRVRSVRDTMQVESKFHNFGGGGGDKTKDSREEDRSEDSHG